MADPGETTNITNYSHADNLKDLIADYEAIARHNRPDWDAFLAEARDDVYGIACEVIDYHDDFAGTIAPGLAPSDALDMVCDAVDSWLASLRPAT